MPGHDTRSAAGAFWLGNGLLLFSGVTWFTWAARGVSYQCQISPILEVRFGDRMAAIARALARAFPETRIEVETLKTIAMFCGVGLVVLLLLATYGLDLSAGIF